MKKIFTKVVITAAFLIPVGLILFPKTKERLLNDFEYLKELVIQKFKNKQKIDLSDILMKAAEFENKISNTQNNKEKEKLIENAANFYIFAIEKYEDGLKEYKNYCKAENVREIVEKYLQSRE